MKNPIKIVVVLFVMCLSILVAAFGLVTYLAAFTENDPAFLQSLSESIWSTIEVFAGAVVGALSAAFAQAFGSKSEV